MKQQWSLQSYSILAMASNIEPTSPFWLKSIVIYNISDKVDLLFPRVYETDSCDCLTVTHKGENVDVLGSQVSGDYLQGKVLRDCTQ